MAMHLLHRLRHPASGALEVLKLAALAAMVVDHAVAVAWGDQACRASPVTGFIRSIPSTHGDSRLRKWATLPTSSQVFVLQQIRDWVFGHYTLFNAPNAAWAAQDAEAYFWN
jgi:hypothetical protein